MRKLVLALPLLLVLPAVADAQLVREGATVQLGPHTYAIPDFNVGLVPNVGIVVGEHTVGYVAFPDDARYVNSTIQEAEFAANGMGMVQRFAGRSALTAELLADAERRVADITFEREYELDLGGVTVRMLVVGPTHTRGDTGFYVEEDRVLFTGDVVMNDSFLAANQASSVTAWLAAFDAFEAMGPSTIVPAHGAIGDGGLIPMQRLFVTRVRDRARALKAHGRSADDDASTIQAEIVAEHPGWPRANGIASLARSAWAEAP